jgi:pimeloyl-ACP methyl ester carboxylesterase
MRRRLSLCSLLVVSLLLSTGQFAQAQAIVPRYESADCRFEAPANRIVECGYLIVPEDRRNPTGSTIKLHVAVIKALNANPEPDPVIYLEGGPGGYSLETLEYSFDSFKPFSVKRDFIMFDQRGVGLSEPALDCPEEVAIDYESVKLDLTVKELRARYDKAIQICHDRLVAQGINLQAYNTAANAADLYDLRIALGKTYGYTGWNLYGISYGTRLALTEMRDFPAGIRSVILDSTVPLQADLFGKIPLYAERAFNVLFDGCKKDKQCNVAYPNLESEFYKLADDLAASPVTQTVENPLTGEAVDIVINGNRLVNTLFDSLYATTLIPSMPAIIYLARNGNYGPLAQLIMIFLLNDESFSSGMYYSVQCAEEISFVTHAMLRSADQAYPRQRKVLDMGKYISVCGIWGVKPALAIENQPVISELPTLVLAGEYDPITPPIYGKEASKTLKNSTWLEFPGIGHGVSISDRCPEKIMLNFLDDPTQKLDASCIDTLKLPKFVILKQVTAR